MILGVLLSAVFLFQTLLTTWNMAALLSPALRRDPLNTNQQQKQQKQQQQQHTHPVEADPHSDCLCGINQLDMIYEEDGDDPIGMGAILEEDPESLEQEEQVVAVSTSSSIGGKRSRSLPQEEEFRVLTQKLRELERADSGLSARYVLRMQLAFEDNQQILGKTRNQSAKLDSH